MKTFCDFIPSPFGKGYFVMHTDGVGSKVSYCLSRHPNIGSCAQDALAMNYNDMAAIGCVGPWHYTNTIHVHPNCEYLVPIIRSGFREQDKAHGLICVSGETCVTDTIQDVLIDVTMTSPLQEPLWNLEDVMSGDTVWGWKTIGPGSNGYTMLRKWTDDLQYSSCEVLAWPTSYFKLAEHNLNGVKALIHCTGDGLFKSRRWDIKIDFDWQNIRWPYWIDDLAIKSGIPKPTMMEWLNGGYQMIAFGAEDLDIGPFWCNLGRVI